jgi:hypothetical protein
MNNTVDLATISQWAAAILSLLSVWLYGRKSLLAPVVGLLSQVAWMTTVITLHLSVAIAGMSCIFSAMHIYNFIKWARAS